MTWRRFTALVAGLSEWSVFRSHLASRKRLNAVDRLPGPMITDAKEGEAAMLNLIRGGG